MFDRPASQLVGWSLDRPVTWAELCARAAALSRQLDASGAAAVVLACARPFPFLTALLAAWRGGREALIPSSLQPEAITMLKGTGVAVLRDTDIDALSTTTSTLLNVPVAASCRLALYTSGSTGAAKRVEKTLAQLEREIENLHAVCGATLAGSSVLATVPHYHIYGLLFRVLWPLAAGRPVEETTISDPMQLRACAEKRGAYVLVSTPAHLARFPDLLPLAEWRKPQRVFSSGGPLDAAAAARYRAAFGQAPFEVFGSTETGGVAWRSRDGSAREDAWTPFPGIGVTLGADDALTLDSPYLSERGYCMDDAAELLEDGRFLLRGRLDRVVKVEGKRLSLPQLEQLLARHDWVSGACAVTLAGAQRLGVVIVPTTAGSAALQREGTRAVREALRRHLARELDPTLLPRSFRFVEALPYDERGKLAAAGIERLFAEPSDDA
ncbi:MAG: acyl-CoA synthetase [Betaproteobacteria bacterium]|nr:acyl-CoA synthetase [Betaproteobacteria bacterium]